MKTFTAGAAKADALAWSSIQQSSQILGRMDGGLSRLALGARAAVCPIPSARIQRCCVIYKKWQTWESTWWQTWPDPEGRYLKEWAYKHISAQVNPAIKGACKLHSWKPQNPTHLRGDRKVSQVAIALRGCPGDPQLQLGRCGLGVHLGDRTT